MATIRQRGTDHPAFKNLRFVRELIADKWYDIGLELLEQKDERAVNVIKKNNAGNISECCIEMLELWLNRQPDATWNQLIEALRAPGIELNNVASQIEGMLLSSAEVQPLAITRATACASSSNELVTESSHGNETLDFTQFEDVSLAFSALFSRIQREVKSKNDKDFDFIKIACVARANHKLSEQILRTGDINDLFQLFAENKPHCNWLHVRFLEVIATACGNSELVNLICSYKKIIFSKKLREVWGCLPYHRVRTEYYAKLQIKFDGKDPDSVTVEQLKKMCEPYLIKEIALTFTIIEEESLRVTLLIPTTIVYKAYQSALIIPEDLRLDSLLQIGDWVVHHPRHVLQNLQKDYWWILPSTLLIGYYHSLLLKNVDVNLMVDKMSSSNLLALNDQEMILAGNSIHQSNWILLECVRCMGMQALVKFCEFVREILPEVGFQLLTALDSDANRVTEPHSFIPDKKSLALKNTSTAYSLPSLLHILFLDVIDQVKELLQWHNVPLLTESLKSLMASETHRISLFSDSYIANLSNYTNVASVLQYLSFLFTWSDHSILREFVSYSTEAIQLLDEFDCFLDPFNTIVSYPIDVFSLSMIPSEDSPFTLLAIRSYLELWQCSLQDVFNIRSILVELCEITQHCLQLVALQSDPTLFFWNIPKSIVELVYTNLLKHGEELCSQGIVEVTVYPKHLIFAGDDIVVGSFGFMIKQEEICQNHKSLHDKKTVQQESEIRIINKAIIKENKQQIGNKLDQNIAQQELVSKLEPASSKNKQLIEDLNIRQQELGSKHEASSEESTQLINPLDQKVAEKDSEIQMLNFELKELRKKHKQLIDAHSKVKSEFASVKKVGEQELVAKEFVSLSKVEEQELEIMQKNPEAEMAAKITNASTENLDITKLSSHHALTFSRYERIEGAFERLSDSIKDILKSSNFSAMHQGCMKQIKSLVNRFPESFISSIEQVNETFDDLFLTLSKSNHWNFLDIRMMEAMVTASMVPAAQKSLENFKNTFFSMKLDKALNLLPLKQNHTILKEVLNKDLNKLTIASLHQHHLYLEKMLETALSYHKIMGSAIIGWQIHVDHVYRVHSLLNKKMATLSLEGISDLFIPNAIMWEGLPVTWIGQEAREIGSIEPVTDKVQKEPYSPPEGFEWIFINSEAPEVEIYKKCLGLGRFVLFITFFFRIPNSKALIIKSLHPTTDSLSANSLFGMTQSVKIKEKLLKIVHLFCNIGPELNLLHNTGIKEIMRRFQHDRIYQALLFMNNSNEICKPVVTLTEWKFSLDEMKILPYSTPQTAGLRKMTSKDIPNLLALFNKYTSRFEISSAIQTEDECSLHFLPLQANYVTIITYVVDDPISGEITDMFNLIAIGDCAKVNAILHTRTPPKQLIIDLLLCVKQEKWLKKIETLQFGLKSEIFEEILQMTSISRHTNIASICMYNYSYPEVDEDDFYLILF